MSIDLFIVSLLASMSSVQYILEKTERVKALC